MARPRVYSSLDSRHRRRRRRRRRHRMWAPRRHGLAWTHRRATLCTCMGQSQQAENIVELNRPPCRSSHSTWRMHSRAHVVHAKQGTRGACTAGHTWRMQSRAHMAHAGKAHVARVGRAHVAHAQQGTHGSCREGTRGACREGSCREANRRRDRPALLSYPLAPLASLGPSPQTSERLALAPAGLGCGRPQRPRAG